MWSKFRQKLIGFIFAEHQPVSFDEPKPFILLKEYDWPGGAEQNQAGQPEPNQLGGGGDEIQPRNNQPDESKLSPRIDDADESPASPPESSEPPKSAEPSESSEPPESSEPSV